MGLVRRLKNSAITYSQKTALRFAADGTPAGDEHEAYPATPEPPERVAASLDASIQKYFAQFARVGKPAPPPEQPAAAGGPLGKVPS